MQIIELDLTGCKSLGEIHKRIKEAFDFPHWYGENWSAFWDLLRSDCDADKVIIKGVKGLPEKEASCLPKIYEILERNAEFCKKMNFPPFTYEVID